MQEASADIVACGLASLAVGGHAKRTCAVDYPITENRAWEIAKAVLREAGAQAIEEHPAQAYMLTVSPNSLGVSGALVGGVDSHERHVHHGGDGHLQTPDQICAVRCAYREQVA